MDKQRKVSFVVNRTMSAELSRSVEQAQELLTELGVAIDTSETYAGAADSDLILVLGGDGTLLRGSEIGRAVHAPVMAINYGHMGFLSEADPADLPTVAKRIAAGDWRVEKRMTIDIQVIYPDGKVAFHSHGFNCLQLLCGRAGGLAGCGCHGDDAGGRTCPVHPATGGESRFNS